MTLWMLGVEVVQIKSQKLDYLKSKENLLDIVMLTLAIPMLFLPDL